MASDECRDVRKFRCQCHDRIRKIIASRTRFQSHVTRQHDCVRAALEKGADLAFLDVGAIAAVGDDEVEPGLGEHIRHALDGVGNIGGHRP